MAARTMELATGRYEVQEVELGTVYRWSPGGMTDGCCCAGAPALTEPEVSCGHHPWRRRGDRDDAGLPY